MSRQSATYWEATHRIPVHTSVAPKRRDIAWPSSYLRPPARYPSRSTPLLDFGRGLPARYHDRNRLAVNRAGRIGDFYGSEDAAGSCIRDNRAPIRREQSLVDIAVAVSIHLDFLNRDA